MGHPAGIDDCLTPLRRITYSKGKRTGLEQAAVDVRQLAPCDTCVQSRAVLAARQSGSRQGANAQVGTQQKFRTTKENFMKSKGMRIAASFLALTIGGLVTSSLANAQ